jgi:single-strand DNA-binding protein
VSTAPEERVLPSGTLIVTFRVSVTREASPMTNGSKQSSDWVDGTAWGAKARRAASRWRAGDVVEVEGALRRRFQRGDAGTSTRLEVEVLSGRLVTRAVGQVGSAATAAGADALASVH